jgi:ABC-type branched-subunit amino acid transport system substrate-binding protein
VVHSLGLTRVGIAFSRNTYGSDMNAGFTAACTALNISIVASAGMDYLQQLTATQQAAAQASFAAEVQSKFTRENVKVYLLAIDGTDVVHAAFILHSMGFLAAAGHTVLLPSHLILTGSAPNSQYTAVQNMFTGSIGIYPVSDSVTTAEMRAAWPKNAANWSALLATHRQLANVTNLAPPDPEYIGLWAQNVWDGTLFLAKAISTAWVDCELTPPFYDRPAVQCLVDVIRNTSLNGTTGPITLDSNGDRMAQFGVFNLVNRQRVQTGTVDAAQGVGDVDVERIVWSDGVSNRSAAPAWGQEPHPSTPAPTAVPPGERPVSASENTLYIAISSSVLLMAVFLIGVYRQHRTRVQKMRPMDFRKVPRHV